MSVIKRMCLISSLRIRPNEEETLSLQRQLETDESIFLDDGFRESVLPILDDCFVPHGHNGYQVVQIASDVGIQDATRAAEKLSAKGWNMLVSPHVFTTFARSEFLHRNYDRVVLFLQYSGSIIPVICSKFGAKTGLFVHPFAQPGYRDDTSVFSSGDTLILSGPIDPRKFIFGRAAAPV